PRGRGVHGASGRCRRARRDSGHVLLARLRRLAAVLSSLPGRIPSGGPRPRQPPSGTGRRGLPGRRHRARDRGLPAQQRNGGVHFPDQRVACDAARRLHPPAAPRARAAPLVSRPRRSTGCAGCSATVDRSQGVLLSPRGTRTADRDRCTGVVDGAVLLVETRASAGLEGRMKVDLSSKVAIVTGSGQGIGEGIARVFARAGAKVVIATRSEGNGRAVADSIVQAGHVAWLNRTDVGRRSEVKRVVEETVAHFGRLDIVVHNAAVYPVIAIEQLSDEDLDRTLAVNLKAGFWLIQAALPHLRKQGGGRLLFTSSVTGPHVAMPGTAHYAAAKSGINGLIRTAALEFAREGITVNGVEPGYILTPAMAALGSEAEIAAMAKCIPLGKLGAPLDIANAMLFLASDEAAYITGQTIVVDGGSTLPESPLVLDAYYNSRQAPAP